MAIDLPASARQLLADLDPDLDGVRWLGPELMHLTLSFFGSVLEEAELKLRETQRDSFRPVFSTDQRPGNISSQRAAEDYLDRCR